MAMSAAFNLLPDAEHHPHPRFAWLLACCLHLSVEYLYRIESVLPQGFRLPPGSLIVSNHVRDSDVPILTVTLCRRHGLRFSESLPFFAAREDLFRRGGLAGPGWPIVLRRLLALIPVGWFLHHLQARPMRRLREFTLAETVAALREAGLEAQQPGALFNARGQRELAQALCGLPPRLAAIDPDSLGRTGASLWGLRRLRLATLRQIDHRFRAHIAEQLAAFSDLLAQGRTVYVAPEGVLSCTGRFGRVRAAPRLLSQRSSTPVIIVPNALSYDPLRAGRLRVVVRVGEPVRGLDSTDSRRFSSHLQRDILQLRVVTVSHLMAWFIATGPSDFTTSDFIDGLQRGVAIATGAALTVDPLLARVSPAALAGERLRWLQHKRLIHRSGRRRWRNTWPHHASPGWSRPAGIVALLANSLADLSPLWCQGPRA